MMAGERSQRAALGLAVAVILGATLIPTPQIVPVRTWCLLCRDRDVSDAILNVALFAPLGAALAFIGVGARRALLIGGAMSVVIELLQSVIPGREPYYMDVVSNATGAVVGVFGLRLLGRVSALPRARSGQVSLGLAAAATLVMLMTSWLLAPAFPADRYFGQWVPPRRGWEPFTGRVLQARISATSLPDGPLESSDVVRALLRSGAPIEVRAIAGQRPASRTPVFAIADAHEREELLLGFERRDFLIRFRTRSAAWRLDQPALRARDLVADVGPSDTLTIRVWRPGSGWCADAARSARCDIGFGIGSGWRVLYSANWFPHWIRVAAGFVWLAVLAAPFGFTARPTPASALGAVLLAGTLAAGPRILPVIPTSVLEWTALVLGIALAALGGRAGLLATGTQDRLPQVSE